MTPTSVAAHTLSAERVEGKKNVTVSLYVFL